jgi:hypothetical protein
LTKSEIFLAIAGCLAESEGRRETNGGLDVRVELPKYPKVGEGAVLTCKYNLGSDTLYTVKWYKGNGEFYRFTPKELPAIKIFKFPGLEVDVSPLSLSQWQKFRVGTLKCLVVCCKWGNRK